VNIFEAAARAKLRFETHKGLINAEDLWDLPLTSSTGRVCLDGIAMDLHRQLRTTAEVVSFVDDKATTDPMVQLRFDIVKHVIEQRKKENADAATAKARAETKQRLLEALAKRQDSALDAMSEEDLLKKLSEL
jgi:hypothetical protein